MVASGALHASALSLLRKYLTPENGELFELCLHKSARKVEELLAARFPRPDVRDLVRRLPAQVGFTLDVGCSAEKPPSDGSPRETSRELEKPPPESQPSGAPASVSASSPAEGQKAPGSNRFPRIAMVFISPPMASFASCSRARPRVRAELGSNSRWRRHCPAAVARAVFLRDGKQCSYVSPDGRRCSTRRCLELDHGADAGS